MKNKVGLVIMLYVILMFLLIHLDAIPWESVFICFVFFIGAGLYILGGQK